MNRELIAQGLYWSILAPCIAVMAGLILSYAYDLFQSYRRRRAKRLAERMDPVTARVESLVRAKLIRR